MSTKAHTYQQNCRLAPISHDSPHTTYDDTPRIDARFFYTSLIPIDDPLSPGTLAHASDVKSARSRLRPFCQADNIALEKAWLSLASEQDGAAHHKARDSDLLGPVIEKANERKLAALVQRSALTHFKKHVGSATSHSISATQSNTESTTPASLCCSELYLDVSADLQNTFCALIRRRQSILAAESVIQKVMLELRRMLLESETSDESINRQHSATSATRKRADSTRSAQFTHGSPPVGLESTKGSTLRFRPGSRAREDSHGPQTLADISLSRVAVDDGISGTPFARVGSLGSTPDSTASAFEGRKDHTEGTTSGDFPANEPGRSIDGAHAYLAAVSSRESENDDAQNGRPAMDVPVGLSRLHMVSLPSLQMKPIYWSPVNDIAIVLRGTWFYRDTMNPLPPAVANQMEAGYRELKPYTETWSDELRCAIDVGPLGEEKVSHRLWPDYKQHVDSDLAVDDTAISTDPFCSARCFTGEAAAQGSITPEPDSKNTEQPSKGFASYHVIYKNASQAFLLKPSLKPSAYYGRRPVGKIMRGTTIGIPVVRGFDQDAWDRFHNKKPSDNKADTAAATLAQSGGGAQVCSACKAQVDGDQITDLILVCHGIGQKFAERVESFHFTHAINAFRREVNMELGNPALKNNIREAQNGIMVLPVNWRHTLTLENGGPVQGNEDDGARGLDRFGLKDIEPKTIPAVRSMISDIMFDIPFYMSHHKGQMIEALVKEANRVYRLWCRNNPGFHDQGRVHLIGHSLGSAMAVDILSRQPSRIPSLDLSLPSPRIDHFEFDTVNLFLAGSPAGFFMLLERGTLLPRRGRSKPGAATIDVDDHEVTGEAGSFGCLAVDNIYNILAREDPIAYLLNSTIDPAYAASLKTAYVPSTATSFFKYVSDTMRSIIPGASPAPDTAPNEAPKPSMARLPSQLELEVHDFSREEIAERKAYLLNDNGQIDFYLRSGGGPLEIQYLNMLSAHSSYWLSRDFIRMLCMEVSRKPGRDHTVPAMRVQKATKRTLVATG